MPILTEPCEVLLLTPVSEALIPQVLPLDTWAAQPKYDGDRIVIHKEGDKIWAHTRDLAFRQLNAGIIRSVKELPGETLVLDGELIKDTFVAFDLLFLYEDIRSFSFASRWDHLLKVVPERGLVQRALTVWTPTEKEHLYKVLQREGQEGIVFRRRDAKYQYGRQPTAMKIKFWKTLTAICLAHNETKKAWENPPYPYELTELHGRRSIQLGLLDGTKITNVGNLNVPGNRPVPSLGGLVEVRYIYAFPDTKNLFHGTLLKQRDDLKMADCTVDQLQYKR